MLTEKYHLRESITIDHIYTFHYRELRATYDTGGERHLPWELAYLDKGAVSITTDSGVFELQQGDLIFYAPNEHHHGKALHGTAPNFVNITFECAAPQMMLLRGIKIPVQPQERNLLANIIRAGIESFGPKDDVPYQRIPPRPLPDAPFGAEQLIKNYLEIFIIKLVRRISSAPQSDVFSASTRRNEEDDIANNIVKYMKNNLDQHISLTHLCKEFSMGRTQLGEIFKARYGISVMAYFNKLIVDEAKHMIRQELYTFTEVSEHLGYSSVHNFSRQFKNVTNMTPTEYARTVNARSRVQLR